MSENKISKEDFLTKYRFPADSLEQIGVTWDELMRIWDDHQLNTKNLLLVASYVSQSLQQFANIHSVRFRVKDPEHLLEKIVRKCLENPKRQINFENYRKQITDLIGVRALHLFKEDWDHIHDEIIGKWNLAEKPIAYIRVGDDEGLFKKKRCKIKPHKYKYRSVHYLLIYQPSREKVIVELQVRTIFEEAWSEIDHKVLYPYDLQNEMLRFASSIQNRLAGTADEIASFMLKLRQYQKDRENEFNLKLNEINALAQKLQGAESDKAELEKKISSLKSREGNLFSVSPIAIQASEVTRQVTSTLPPGLLNTLRLANDNLVKFSLPPTASPKDK
ncbi:MAG: RelA/SpoT domain-containing protein [Anaerolineae bacterium]|nr:RelA/SpoT domain-containing protein [Anaerolineae bacterium]